MTCPSDDELVKMADCEIMALIKSACVENPDCSWCINGRLPKSGELPDNCCEVISVRLEELTGCGL